MNHPKAHRGVRKLRYFLYRQLKYLRRGLIEEALSVFPHIEKTIKDLSKEKIDDELSLKIIKESHLVNDEILQRFEAEKDGAARGLFRAEVERKIKEFLD